MNLLTTKTKQSSGSMVYYWWQKNAQNIIFLEGNAARIELEDFPPRIHVGEIITKE